MHSCLLQMPWGASWWARAVVAPREWKYFLPNHLLMDTPLEFRRFSGFLGIPPEALELPC